MPPQLDLLIFKLVGKGRPQNGDSTTEPISSAIVKYNYQVLTLISFNNVKNRVDLYSIQTILALSFVAKGGPYFGLSAVMPSPRRPKST